MITITKVFSYGEDNLYFTPEYYLDPEVAEERLSNLKKTVPDPTQVGTCLIEVNTHSKCACGYIGAIGPGTIKIHGEYAHE